MKRLQIVLLFLLSSFTTFAQNIPFPPELHWWLSEVQKANPSIALGSFALADENDFPKQRDKIPIFPAVYPVFKRWNYSAELYGYFNLGVSLARNPNGLYVVESGDPDSHIFIADKHDNVIYWESFGSSSGIDALAWLRDNILVAVGTEHEYVNQDTSTISLIIKVYTIKPDKITATLYRCRSAFNSAADSSPNLNWIHQRPDYFQN